MKITREFCGQMVEIELTEQELYQAYAEQEHLFDLDSCSNEFEMRYGEEDWYELISEEDREFIVEEAADCLRRYLDKYDTSFDYAMDAAFGQKAVLQIIDKYEKGEFK